MLFFLQFLIAKLCMDLTENKGHLIWSIQGYFMNLDDSMTGIFRAHRPVTLLVVLRPIAHEIPKFQL
jgi:hypothetical protein